MNNKVSYKNEYYTVIKNIFIEKTEIAICIDDSNTKVIYLKVNYIGERATYVSLDNLIRVLPDYQNIASQNKKIILDSFIDELNSIIESLKFFNLDYIFEIIEGFEEYMSKNEIYYYTTKNIDIEIPESTILKLKKYLRSYNRTISDISKSTNNFVKFFKKTKLVLNKILNNKFCGAYSIMVIVSAVGMMICINEYSNWKSSGTETATIMDDILNTTQIDYGNEENERLNEILSSQTDPNSSPVTESEMIAKYGSDYWTYKRASLMSVDFTDLLAKNPDTVGWLYVNNTNVNYPVVQYTDNNFYLNHSFDASNNVAGWIFADYRADMVNLKQNTVIYGHGRVDQVMFGSLDNVLKPEWYQNESNQYIKLSTPSKNMVWKIVSVYTIRAETYYLTPAFGTDESFRAFLNTIVGRSIYNFNTDVNVNDKILTLSTCLDTNGNRIVVHAKLVREENR